MIPRITRGGSAYGAMHYDHGPGRRDEHENPHKVAGTVGGKTWKERAHAIDQHIKNTRPEITKPIVRTSLRLAQEDRQLTDKEWRQIAERYAEKMGFKDCPWEAVRHADDHMHLTISRITWDGKVIDQRDNYKNAQTVVRGIEKKHDLINAAERYRRIGHAEISRNDHTPHKEALRDRITAAEHASTGTRASYEKELAKRGVHYRANESKPTDKNPHGKMNGYSYADKNHRDAHGEQVWFKGSKLGREHGWTATEKRLAERAEQSRERLHEPTTQFEGKAAQPSRQPMSREQAQERAAAEARSRRMSEESPTLDQHVSVRHEPGDDAAGQEPKSDTAPRRPMTREEAGQRAMAEARSRRTSQPSQSRDEQRGPVQPGHAPALQRPMTRQEAQERAQAEARQRTEEREQARRKDKERER